MLSYILNFCDEYINSLINFIEYCEGVVMDYINIENRIMSLEDEIIYRRRYNDVMSELRSNMRYRENILMDGVVGNIRGKRCVIIYLGVFNSNDKWEYDEILRCIVYSCIRQHIPIILIGEKNPNIYLNIINNKLGVHFTVNNYITPYHYKSRWLDSPIRTLNNKIMSKPCKISLNQIIEDLIDEYNLNNNVLIIKNKNDI